MPAVNTLPSNADVRADVAMHYNSKHLHSTPDYKTPMDYEKSLNKVSWIS